VEGGFNSVRAAGSAHDTGVTIDDREKRKLMERKRQQREERFGGGVVVLRGRIDRFVTS
jgi:hypothetical protein